jgi:hypothetical protein
MRFGGLDRIFGETGQNLGSVLQLDGVPQTGRVQRRVEANLDLPHAISVVLGDRASKLISGRGSHDGCVTTGAERHPEQFCTNLLELAVVAGHHINPGEPPDFSSCFGDHSLAVTAFQIRGRVFDDEIRGGRHKTTLRRASYHLLRGKPAISEEFVRNLLSAGLDAGATRGTLQRSLNMPRSTAAESALPLRCVLTCNFRSACSKRQTEHSALVSRRLHNHHPGTLHSGGRPQTSPERRGRWTRRLGPRLAGATQIGTGEDRDPKFTAAEHIQGMVHPVDQRSVDGVQALRSVQGDAGDVVLESFQFHC